jgi:uncharacterized protein (TIRG00374 family)
MPLVRAGLSIAARYGFGALLVYWLAHTQALDFTPLDRMSTAFIVQCAALGIAVTALSSWRIRSLLRDQRIEVSYQRCFAVNCLGLFYSLFLPGGISGDAARAVYFFGDAGERRIRVVGALLLDRLIGLITLVALGIASGAVLASTLPRVVPYLAGSAALLLVMLGAFVLVVRYEIEHRESAGAHRLLRLWGRIKAAYAGLRFTDYSTRTLVLSVLLSILMNVAMIVLIYAAALHAASGASFIEVATVSPLGLLTNAVPLSPGGLGVGEKSFDVLFRAMGRNHGAGSFLITRIFLYLPAVLGGILAALALLRVHRFPFARGRLR